MLYYYFFFVRKTRLRREVDLVAEIAHLPRNYEQLADL